MFDVYSTEELDSAKTATEKAVKEAANAADAEEAANAANADSLGFASAAISSGILPNPANLLQGQMGSINPFAQAQAAQALANPAKLFT